VIRVVAGAVVTGAAPDVAIGVVRAVLVAELHRDTPLRRGPACDMPVKI
jgi:hypothetical protein